MFKFKTKPFAHQEEVFDSSKDKTKYALLMEQGTGKTKVTLDTIAYLYSIGEIDQAIIIAPKGICKNWTEIEIPTHLPCDYNYLLWNTSTTKKFNRDFKYFLLSHGLKIFVTNVEAYSTATKISTYIGALLKEEKTMVVVDESSTIKTHNSMRSKNICKLFKNAKYKRILTGTPVTNKPLDIYGQFNFLDERVLGYPSYTLFRKRYAKLVLESFKGRTFYKEVGYQNLEELSKKIQPYSYRVLKQDCLDLPDKVYVKRRIEMTKEQSKLYKEMKESFITGLNADTVVEAVNVVTKGMRLHQICCGFYNSDDGDTITIPGNNPRTEELLNIAEETQDKIIVWAKYIYNIKDIARVLTEKYGDASVVTFTGATETAERDSAVDKFQNDPDCRFFISNKTGAYGLTLTAASTVVYYANDYDIEIRQQSEDRCHRIGQTNKVTYIDLVVENTIDEQILKSLRSKTRIQDLILKQGWSNIL